MPDDKIKAALAEAAWAECEARARVNQCEDLRCPRREPCSWCAASAAAAVAAFLRASDVWNAIMEDYEDVTEAVESAAREGGG